MQQQDTSATEHDADDQQESEYAEFEMINVPERWDADWECLCA